MKYLTIDEVLVLHAYQTDKFGGNPGILDIRLLESALARPKTILSESEMYPTIYDKAAVLATGIINNHPFVDGNKRTGMHAMLVFLELNGIRVSLSNSDLVTLALHIAKKSFTTEKVSKLLRKKTFQHLPK